MPNVFSGTGNLADAPTLRHVQISGEDRTVAEFRVFFGEYRSDGQGGVEQSGGFWLDVSAWDRTADYAVQLLRKGARVHVVGRLKLDRWTDKDTGEEKSVFRLTADEIYLSMSRIEEVKFRPRRVAVDEEPAAAGDETTGAAATEQQRGGSCRRAAAA